MRRKSLVLALGLLLVAFASATLLATLAPVASPSMAAPSPASEVAQGSTVPAVCDECTDILMACLACNLTSNCPPANRCAALFQACIGNTVCPPPSPLAF